MEREIILGKTVFISIDYCTNVYECSGLCITFRVCYGFFYF